MELEEKVPLSLLSLPDDLLISIVAHLSLRDAVAVARTCQRLRAACGHVFREWTSQPELPHLPIATILKLFPNLRVFRSAGLTRLEDNDVVRLCRHGSLHTLDISGSFTLTDAALTDIGTYGINSTLPSFNIHYQ